MNLHERQQFEALLQAAVERFSERIVQRLEGAAGALDGLRRDPDGDGIWLREFVGHLFQDFLLDNSAGACFVLQALERRPAPEVSAGAAVGATLQEMSREAFARLLRTKTEEFLEQRSGYHPVDVGGPR